MYPSLSLVVNLTDRLSLVSVRADPHRGYVNERVWSSAAKCQSLAPRGMKNLVTEVTGSPKGYPRDTLPLVLFYPVP